MGADIDTTRPHPARRYDYWLGGKDNFAVDRDSGDAIAEVYPSVRTAAQENRKFLKRVVSYLTAECGVRQFLDIGTGLPTADNTHEVAQGIAPESRIVYVDNDPLVMSHARALLTSAPDGETAYIAADLREPEKILAQARQVLDFEQPIAVMLVAVLHFVLDTDRPGEAVRTLLEAVPDGSYCVVSHATADPLDADTRAALDKAIADGQHGEFQYRSHDEILELFGGCRARWRLPLPGLAPVTAWGPIPLRDEGPQFDEAAAYGGLFVTAEGGARLVL